MKFSIWIYQKTGYVSRSLIKAEKKFIMDNLNKFYEDYKEEDDAKEFFSSFKVYVRCRVASWQGDIGFCRELYTLINPIVGYKRLFKKLYKRYLK
jgi:hypothetical protein